MDKRSNTVHPPFRSIFRFGKYLMIMSGLLLLTSAGCVSIPKAAPELSVELGKRISSIEDSHIALLRKYMDEKRSRVDEFLIKEWVPLFAKELFSETNIQRAWTGVCTSGTEEDRLKFMTLLGPKIQQNINHKRLELIRPLDDLEKTIERKLRDEYMRAKAINNSITSFLVSAAEVAENRDRLLDMLGVKDNKISDALDETDKAVSTLVKGPGRAIEAGITFKETMDDIIKEFKH